MRAFPHLVALVLLLAAPLALGQGVDEVPRVVTASASDGQGTMTLAREGGGIDVVNVDFDAPPARVKVHYERLDRDLNMEAKHMVEPYTLVEFEDEGKDGRYVRGTDRIVAEYSMRTFSWQLAPPVSVNGGHRMEARAFGADGVVTFAIFAAGERTTYNGTEVGPAEVLVEVTLDDLLPQGGITSYAIVWQISQEKERDDGDATGTGSGSPADEVTTYLRWSGQATVDGEPRDAGTFEEEGGGTITTAFPVGKLIRHTGVIGIALAGGNDAPGPGWIAVVALVGALVWATGRRA